MSEPVPTQLTDEEADPLAVVRRLVSTYRHLRMDTPEDQALLDKATDLAERALDVLAARLSASTDRAERAEAERDEALLRLQRIIELEPVAHAAEQLRASDGSFTTQVAGVRLEKCDEYGRSKTTAERDALAAKLEAVERMAKWELGQTSTVLKSEIRDALAVQSVQETDQ